MRKPVSNMRHALVAGAMVFLAAGAWAPRDAAAADDDPNLLTFSLGWFDLIDNNESSAAAGVEWMSGRRYLFVKPLAGLMATTDGSAYGYGGLGVDLYFGPRWVVTPSLAVGAYGEGDGKDLGSVVEFRSSVAIAYRFDDRSRVGLRFYHLSNAGLDDTNPGTEVLDFTYSLPLGR